VSGALAQAAAFATAWALAPAAALSTLEATERLFQRALSGDIPGSAELVLLVVTLAAPLMLAAGLAAAAFAVAQSGGMFAPRRLVPDLSRANPFTGLRRLVEADRLFSLGRSLLGASLTAAVTFYVLGRHLPDVAGTAGRVDAALGLSGELALSVAGLAVALGFTLGGADLAIVRFSHRKRHRMTKDEVKREHKESEGDPEIRAARQRAHQEVLDGTAIAAVKGATIVIVNPTHLATALRYDEERDEAPRVVSRGRGDLARKIAEAARAYGVPVVQDVPIAHALDLLEIGDEIPESLYEAIAEILRAAWEHDADGSGH
jgi:flagellar biosynthesis protein FlhB